MRSPLPPIAAVVSFIDCINRGDVDGLSRLITEDHVLQVLAESPVVGREQNSNAWRGYVSSFREYVIYPECMVGRDSSVAVLGRTTRSHGGLPDEQELQLTVIWVAEVREGKLTRRQILDDTSENRATSGLG